jgi:hypothetical protein
VVEFHLPFTFQNPNIRAATATFLPVSPDWDIAASFKQYVDNSGDANPLGALMAPGNVQERPHADHSSEHPPLRYKFPTTRYFINLRERANKIIMGGRLTQAEAMLLTTFGDLLVHLEHLEAVAEKRERKSKGDGTKVPSLPVVESFDAPPGMQGQNGKSMLQTSDNTPSQDWKFGKPNLSKPEPDTNNNIWGAWGAAEEETAKKGTQFDPSDNVQEGSYGDHESEYEEPSEQDCGLPSRNIQSAPFGYRNTLQDPALKARYDLLVQGGTLISEEIQLLEASDGNTLLTLLKHFEILASKRAFGAGSEWFECSQRLPVSRSSRAPARVGRGRPWCGSSCQRVDERVQEYVWIRVCSVFQDTLTEII